MAKKAILIDAMFTIFTPRSGLNRYLIYQNLIRQYLGQDVELEKLTRAYDEKRKQWEQILPARHGQKWSIIAREIILTLLPDTAPAEAERVGRIISNEFLTNPNFYEILPETKSFLQAALNRGLRVIIASNQDREKLEDLIDQFSLRPLFAGVYASTEIGYEKPDPRFFHEVLEKEMLLPSECVMIGNNPDNDVQGAANLEITGILYDLYEKHSDFPGYRVTRLSETLKLDIFQ